MVALIYFKHFEVQNLKLHRFSRSEKLITKISLHLKCNVKVNQGYHLDI